MSELDPDALVGVTLSCPPVAAMAGGRTGEVATYLPGRRVPGVRLRDDAVELHVVARWGANLPLLGEEVRAAVASLVSGRPVDVFIDDILLPDQSPSAVGPPELPPTNEADEEGAVSAPR